MYRKNTSGQFVGVQMVLTSTGAIATGLSPTVRRCIDGAFAAATGTVTEDTGTGGYKFAMSQADTNGNDISFWFTATGAIPVCVNIVTTAADPTNAATFGITDIDATISSRMAASSAPTNFGALGISAGGHISNVDTLTTYTGNTVQTGDAFARLGAPAGASVSADIAAAKVDTAAIKVQSDKLTFTVANQIDSNVLDWKSATAPAMTGDAFARLGAPAGASVSADIAAVKSDTGTVLTDVNSGAGAIYNRLGTPAGASIAADIAAAKVDTAAVKVQTDKMTFTVANQIDANPLSINGNASAASNLSKSAKAIVRGTCSGGSTTTAVVSSMTTPATLTAAGQLIGRTILFDDNTTTAALQGQASNITNNTTGATPTITFAAMTTAPANTDTFSIL